MESIASQKSALRHTILRRRSLVPQTSRLASAKQLAHVTQRVDLVKAHATIACFVSMGSEVRTSGLLQYCMEQSVRVLVPRLGKGLDMGWSYYSGAETLEDKGERRPAEPTDEILPPEALEQATTIIIAALAVDSQGNRLGRGAGWYDQALQYRNPDARIIAVCWPWEVSQVPIPHDSNDVAVDGVLTPLDFTPIDKP
ncbi:5-formyltetrahydrofolate cyclo-ligase [Bifidobacterium aquikefiricola]|uniref:5-formyltetrahydrofolate cyclo-ligase n=1 Tax=Bifidobacterium aquikefiricola TaxID=3059038 RepID=A0AB39U5A8_9BIFI